MQNTADSQTGEERFAHNWMRQNERDMASLAWELAAARERRGLGSIGVLHQLGHPEKRKAVYGPCFFLILLLFMYVTMCPA